MRAASVFVCSCIVTGCGVEGVGDVGLAVDEVSASSDTKHMTLHIDVGWGQRFFVPVDIDSASPVLFGSVTPRGDTAGVRQYSVDEFGTGVLDSAADGVPGFVEVEDDDSGFSFAYFRIDDSGSGDFSVRIVAGDRFGAPVHMLSAEPRPE